MGAPRKSRLAPGGAPTAAHQRQRRPTPDPPRRHAAVGPAVHRRRSPTPQRLRSHRAQALAAARGYDAKKTIGNRPTGLPSIEVCFDALLAGTTPLGKWVCPNSAVHTAADCRGVICERGGCEKRFAPCNSPWPPPGRDAVRAAFAALAQGGTAGLGRRGRRARGDHAAATTAAAASARVPWWQCKRPRPPQAAHHRGRCAAQATRPRSHRVAPTTAL